MAKTLQPSSVDPTKMGLGRSIAVLTSGGDAQGKRWLVASLGALLSQVCREAAVES